MLARIRHPFAWRAVVRYASQVASVSCWRVYRHLMRRRQTLTILILEAAVASVCDVCGKGPGFGNNVSHSHVRTRRRWNPNIQTVRAIISGTPKRLNVCTSCIKAGKVTRSAAS
jgi:large subunit ribosomal protein L28